MERPEPITTTDGPDSEFFARTRCVRQLLRCPVCAFRCGAEARHVEGSRLPPELRTMEDWQQEAEAQRVRQLFDRSKAIARRTYDAHSCAHLSAPHT